MENFPLPTADAAETCLDALLLLAEVSHQMASLFVILCENVKKEWLHIVIEGFVVKKELNKKAEILAINLVCIPVHFKDGKVPFPVNLNPRRMSPEEKE